MVAFLKGIAWVWTPDFLTSNVAEGTKSRKFETPLAKQIRPDTYGCLLLLFVAHEGASHLHTVCFSAGFPRERGEQQEH